MDKNTCSFCREHDRMMVSGYGENVWICTDCINYQYHNMILDRNALFSKLTLRHDKDADVLYISFGEPRPGIATEVSDRALLRVDPETNNVIGITIIDFKERYGRI